MSCEKLITENEINSQVYIMLNLVHIPTGNPILIVCTHLKAQTHHYERRRLQMNEILKSLRLHLAGDNNSPLDSRYPVILTGDLNGEPDEEFHKSILNFPDLSLRDAYTIISNGKKESTLRVKRENGMDKVAIDYLFFNTKSMDLLGYLELPDNSEKYINEHGLPNLTYSSDHLSLVCDFKFLTDIIQNNSNFNQYL